MFCEGMTFLKRGFRQSFVNHSTELVFSFCVQATSLLSFDGVFRRSATAVKVCLFSIQETMSLFVGPQEKKDPCDNVACVELTTHWRVSFSFFVGLLHCKVIGGKGCEAVCTWYAKENAAAPSGPLDAWRRLCFSSYNKRSPHRGPQGL